MTYSLGPAGSVAVTFLDQQFVGGVVDLAPGWSVNESDADSDRIRLELVRGASKVIWTAQIENDQVNIDLRVVGKD